MPTKRNNGNRGGKRQRVSPSNVSTAVQLRRDWQLLLRTMGAPFANAWLKKALRK